MSLASTDSPAAAAGKYLTFVLAGEQFGIAVLAVREILGLLPVTPVPRTPHSVLGVIDLRGTTIPIVDLRRQLGIEPASAEEAAAGCIIVVEIEGTLTGLVVDRLSVVSEIAAADISVPPAFDATDRTDYLSGIARSEGQITLLVDIRCVLRSGGSKVRVDAALQPTLAPVAA